MKTPVSLLDRLRRSPDPAAWNRFVGLYLPLVCCWARRAGLQDADVADLSQEVFTLLLRKLADFEHDGSRSFRAWLRTVTLNKWRELCRKRGTAVRVADGTLDDLTAADPAPALWDQEHNAYLAARALRLMQGDFEPATWQACWACTVEEKPPAEVAAALGISVGSVYTAKSRVLRRLRQELEGLI